MKTYITFTKSKLLVLFFALVCFAIVYSQIYTVGNYDIIKTNADRIEFLKRNGYAVVDDQPVVKTVIIPINFGDVYKNYNKLQRLAGYDLSLYKGCKVCLYTYNVKPPKGYTGDCVANIIIYKNRIIGGDVSSCALGGFMLPLKLYN